MSSRFSSFRILIAICLLALSERHTSSASAQVTGPAERDLLLARAAIKELESWHLQKPEMTDELAAEALGRFVRRLDPDKLYFHKDDIAEFDKRKKGFGKALKLGSVGLPFDVYRRFQQRVGEAGKLWKESLASGVKFSFDVPESIILHPDALDFAKDEKAWKERWRLTLKHRLLQIKTDPEAGKFDLAEASASLLRRYENAARPVQRATSDDVLESFMAALGECLDQSTFYVSPSSVEEDSFRTSGALVGIGVQIRLDDRLRVTGVEPSGPAQKKGIRKNDMILRVAQGEKALKSVDGMTLKDVTRLLRGPLGSEVRIEILRPETGKTLILTVPRERIATTEARIDSRIVEHGRKPEGSAWKIGWIELPGFVADPKTRTGTADAVRKILEGFKKAGVDILLLDLRRNMGGVMAEVMATPGLFLGDLPVLQQKSSAGKVAIGRTAGPIAWTKGLVILTSDRTAGGGEIMCAALQDSGRALVLGPQSSYGAALARSGFRIDLDSAKGSAKGKSADEYAIMWIPTSQLFRTTGEGVHDRGVSADIVLPALPGQRSRVIRTARLEKVNVLDRVSFGMLTGDMADQLREKSRKRRETSVEFAAFQKRIEWEWSREAQLLAPLEEKKYREFVKANTPPPLPGTKEGEIDFYLREVLAITADYAAILGPKQAGSAEIVKAASDKSGPKLDRATRKRSIETEILELTRAAERKQQDVTRLNKEIANWDEALRAAMESVKKGDPAGKGASVEEALRFAFTRKTQAQRDRDLAEAALRLHRDQIANLRKELESLKE